MNVQVVEEDLDQEWVSLILTARSMGITVEEIRDFFAKSVKTEHERKGIFNE